MSIATGTRLGAYEVQDFIGQGAMGLVYRAYHPELERTGAVKVMQAITPDADTVARFRHEAKAIAQLRHPNIVQVYDFGEFQGTPYMIVEYIPGGSLAQKMAAAPVDQATALRYLRGIAAGLDYAHRHGVIHRDVKPANVLLTAEDTPVLADFGLAKLLQGNSLKSMTGVTTGTPAYMAPEQVMGHNVGPAADRYSLATIAYEMLTGVIPFDGEGLMELLYAQVHREPPVPSWRNSALGPKVDAVVMQGLAKDPAARWSSATAFVDALESALAARQLAAAGRTVVLAPPPDASTLPMARTAVAYAPVIGVESTEDLTRAYPSPPPPQPKTKRRMGRRVAAAIAAAVVLVLVLGVCAFEVLPLAGVQVNPNPAARGDMVTVSASRVPANQGGVIELLSVLHTYSFQADAQGDVRERIRVPLDLDLGTHTVKLCWQDACHRSTQLRVVAGGLALESPTPIANASPTPSFGVTPHPTATPRSSASPTPRSTPRPSPTSTGRPAALLQTDRQSVGIGGTVNLSGYYFNPFREMTITFTPSVGRPTTTPNAAPTDSTGHFALAYKLPASLTGYATIKACDSLLRCATVSILVQA